MFVVRHRVLIGVVAGALVVGAAGLAAAAPGPSGAPAAAPAAVDPEGFVGVTPTRVLDTRAGDGPIGVPAAASLGPNQEITLALTTAAPNRASAPVPADAVSVLLNITIDKNASADSFITVWPTGQPRPNSSANNATPGQVTPNSIVVPLGTGGSVSIYNFTGNVDLAVDLAGYTVPLEGTVLQGPPGPKGDTGAQGPVGPQGPQGPIGPVLGADWKVGTAGNTPLTVGVLATVVTVSDNTLPTPTPANYVVTASFEVIGGAGGTTLSCDLVDDTNTGITGASIDKAPTADETITLTGVAADTTAASLVCSFTGTGPVAIEQSTLVMVGVGDPLP